MIYTKCKTLFSLEKNKKQQQHQNVICCNSDLSTLTLVLLNKLRCNAHF